MKATCPNDSGHDHFITVVHVTEDWVVDARGDFIQVWEGSTSEIVHRPSPYNTWECVVCGAEAKVVEE